MPKNYSLINYIYIYIYIYIYRERERERDFKFVSYFLWFKIEWMDVILTECNLSLHEITSVFQSAVIFMSCRIMEFKICIFKQHFFVNANFIQHNRHFMSTYFLLDPFEFPYYFYRINWAFKFVSYYYINTGIRMEETNYTL